MADLGRILGLVVLATAAAACTAQVLRGKFVSPRAAPPAHADAVIVLGGIYRERVPVGISLVENGVSDQLILSVQRPSEANAITIRRRSRSEAAHRQVLIGTFIPPSDDTRGEAQAIAELVRRHGWGSIAVVTSSYHIARARRVIEAQVRSPASGGAGAGPARPVRIHMVASRPWMNGWRWARRMAIEPLGILRDVVFPPSRLNRPDIHETRRKAELK
ncbi:YdcF family protein [Saxibacter everestensis]|uniref:YdcF family protein n=1 Tax=Saxibacter everestensis TaxID=2909229 RepID=A0ABY8QSB7_9MICO|nr:YdcF family protein [Brevibacteriaceae bacterium ZFBP1038]